MNEVLQHPGKKLSLEVQTDLEGQSDIELLAPLDGELHAVSTGNLLLLNGTFSGKAIVDCARCGGPLEVPIEFDVEEQFPVEGVAACYAMNDSARVVSDEVYPVFEGNSLILDSLLRQDLVVALPLQSLCQYGWEGPCPLAKARSAADAGEGRPEFQKLARLRESEPKSGGEASP